MKRIRTNSSRPAPAVPLHERQQQLPRFHQVDLGQHPDDAGAHRVQQVEEELLAAAPRHGRIHEVEDEVHLLERRANLLHHLRVEAVEGAVDPGKIEEDRLTVLSGEQADDPVAGRLGLGRDDGDFLADEGVQQRALSGIGPAHQGDQAGPVLLLSGHRPEFHPGDVRGRSEFDARRPPRR